MAETGKRQIVLDTETTGKDAKKNRIIEIGAIEFLDREPTGRTFHQYINPEGCPMEEGAFKVHGISLEQLADKPAFKQIADSFLEFIRGSELLIHNATFDIGFLNEELKRMGKTGIWEYATVSCTLKMAQSLYPKQANGLDKLCDRLEIDRSERTLHGALLDAKLLSEAYFKMTENSSPFIDDEAIAKTPRREIQRFTQPRSPVLISLDPTAVSRHEAYLSALEKDNKAPPVWNQKKPSTHPKP